MATGELQSAAWGLVLLTTAAAAAVGAVFHATRYRVRPRRSDRLWRVTLVLSLLVSAAVMLTAAL